MDISADAATKTLIFGHRQPLAVFSFILPRYKYLGAVS